MAWRLSVTQGKQRGQRFELHDGDNVIGRSRKCDVTISSDALDVSGRHLVISVTGNHVEVENTGRHGTRVDNVPLTAPDVLRGGQRILLAKSTEFVLEKCGAEERERVPPQPQPQPASPAVHPPTHTTPLDDDDDDADSMVGIISDDSVDIDLPDEPDSILGPLMNEAPTPPVFSRGPQPPGPPQGPAPALPNGHAQRGRRPALPPLWMTCPRALSTYRSARTTPSPASDRHPRYPPLSEAPRLRSGATSTSPVRVPSAADRVAMPCSTTSPT